MPAHGPHNLHLGPTQKPHLERGWELRDPHPGQVQPAEKLGDTEEITPIEADTQRGLAPVDPETARIRVELVVQHAAVQV